MIKHAIAHWMVRLVLASACFSLPGIVMAQTVRYDVKSQETKYRTPEDMIQLVPVLKSVPRLMQFGRGYTMKLSGTSLRIDHRSRATRLRNTPKTCMIGLSYTATVGEIFSSRIDVPLWDASELALSGWTRSSFTDYAVSMSRPEPGPAGLTLAINARF